MKKLSILTFVFFLVMSMMSFSYAGIVDDCRGANSPTWCVIEESGNVFVDTDGNLSPFFHSQNRPRFCVSSRYPPGDHRSKSPGFQGFGHIVVHPAKETTFPVTFHCMRGKSYDQSLTRHETEHSNLPWSAFVSTRGWH